MKTMTGERAIGILLVAVGILTLLGTTGLLGFGHQCFPAAVLMGLAVVAGLLYRDKGFLIYLAAAEILVAFSLAVLLAGIHPASTIPPAIVFLGISLAMFSVHIKTGRHRKLAIAAMFPAVLGAAMFSSAFPVLHDTLPPVVLLGGLGCALLLIGPLSGKGLTRTIYPALILWTVAATGFLASFRGFPSQLAPTVFMFGLSTPFLLWFARSRRFGLLLTAYILIIIGLAAGAGGFRILPDILPPLIIFFGAALAFLFAFLLDATRWWSALISGMLGVFCLVMIAGAVTGGSERVGGFTFLLGSALVFYFLYLMRDPRNKLAWARYPSVILAILSVLALSSGLGMSLLVSAILIVAGIVLLVRHFKNRT